MPPRITEFPVRQSSATVGTNLTLTCNASGDPTPNVNWTKEGETAAEFNVSGHKLHLVNVKRENFGSYKCTADNGYGTPATSLAVVNVECKFYTLILSLLKDKKTQQYIEFRNSHLHQFMQHLSYLKFAIKIFQSETESQFIHLSLGRLSTRKTRKHFF